MNRKNRGSKLLANNDETLLLPALSLLSIAAALFLITGYVSEWKLSATLLRLNGQTIGIVFRLGNGGTMLGAAYPGSAGLFWHRSANLRMRSPDIRRWLWEFEAHRTSVAPTIWILACPIWCLLIPCSIFPILRLRQRPPNPRGFTVEGGGEVGDHN